MTRRDAPATLRNREPILGVLERWLIEPAEILEIASGSGQHASFLASQLPHLRWQPTDHDPSALASIDAWASEADCAEIAPAMVLDAGASVWPVQSADAIFNANMIHIAAWPVAEGLFAGAGRVLSSSGLLFLYGPFRVGGEATSPSNAAFDESLRARNPEWGVRDIEHVEVLAAANHLKPIEINDLPANNKLLVFRRV